MKKRMYAKWAAVFLSAAMLIGSVEGPGVVNAAGTKGEAAQTEEAAADPDYVFEGNMITNPDFDDEKSGWTFEKGGVAINNGYPKGTNHYFLDPGGKISQKIRVPYTGYYKFSVWSTSGGTGNVFGVKAEGADEAAGEVGFDGLSTYKQQELEVWLDKGTVVELYVKAGSGWVNGDQFYASYNTSKFVDIALNGQFESENGWEMQNAQIADGQAVLNDTDSKISQNMYIPFAGPYYAEIELAGADNASVTFAGETKTSAVGNETVRVEAADLNVGDECSISVEGKAVVQSITVKFDLAKIPNQMPEAKDVVVDGNAYLGELLSASYDFNDPDQHSEGSSEYQWMVSDSADGTYQPIEGANGKDLGLTEDFENRYVKFQVIPVDQYEGKGTPVQSDPIGPVERNVIQNPGFEPNASHWKGISAKNSDAYQGLTRGIVDKGGDGYQTVTIPKTAYYSLSAFTRYGGAKEGKMGVRDEVGNVIKETTVNPSADYEKTQAEEIPLEEGMQVQVFFGGAEDKAYDVDYVVMTAMRDKEIPGFQNIREIVTNPKAFSTQIGTQDRTIHLKYLYGTDLSSVQLENLALSEGASASVQAGDVLDLTKEYEITVTGKEGTEEIWKVTAEVGEKKVTLTSSNQYLQDTFNWAAEKQRQFVMTGKKGVTNKDENHPNGDGTGDHDYIPSYWAGYYDRTAFYTRDFVHQATGGQIAGLEEENFSMFEAFAKECTESRGWYTVWALNFDGTPHTIDYVDDTWFVREVPAQFELVEKAYKQYLWSGDERYIKDENLWNFYTNVMTKYVDTHDANQNGVAQEVGTGIFSGSCTYNERGRHVIEAGDAIGSQYQATLAYAAMLKARGEEEASKEWNQKAADLKKYFNEEWSVADPMDSSYVCAWGPNGERYSDFSKETSWFIPMKMITEPGEKNDAYIDFILENLGEGIGTTPEAPKNLEAYTYIPDMLYLYNRNEEAWKWMKYITSIKDEPHERPSQGTNGDYPEISFTFVSHTIEGMMGVEPDAGQNWIATVPRLPQEVPDVTADYIDIGDSELSLTHVGNTSSTLTNVSGDELTWEARFYGTHPYIKIGSEYMEAQQKEINGETVSYAVTTVKAGESVNAQASDSIPDVQYTITASAEGNGKISPEGAVTVGEHENQTFKLIPDPGFKVKDVIVDGQSAGAVGEYTFQDVTADHSISATFEKAPDQNQGGDNPDGSDPSGGKDNNGGQSDGKGSSARNSVKTGDQSQPLFFLLFGGLAAVAGAVVIIGKRRGMIK